MRFSFSLQRGGVSKRILELFVDLRSQTQTFELAIIVAVALAIQEERNMSDGDAMWSQMGAAMSDKSARQEFSLTQQEIIAANDTTTEGCSRAWTSRASFDWWWVLPSLKSSSSGAPVTCGPTVKISG